MPAVAIRYQNQNTPADRRIEPVGAGQMAFARDWTHRYVALEGGWGSGKTFIGAAKLLALHIHNARKRTGLRGEWEPTFVKSAVLNTTYRNLFDTNVPVLEDHCRKMGISYRTIAAGEKSEMHLLDFGTKSIPSKILLRTADRPDLITGWEVGAYWCDEPARYKEDHVNPKLDPLLQIVGRLRDPKARIQQGLYTYTNEGDTTRIYRMFNESDSDDYALYRATTADNPHVAEFYETMRRTLPEDLQRQYLEGEAISRAGARLYFNYQRSVNVDDKIAVPVPQLPLHLSVDFNIRPGMHGEIGQYWPDRDLFTVVKEIHRPRLSVLQLVEELKGWIGQQGGFKWPILEIYGDQTGHSKWAGTGESCVLILCQALDSAGIPYRVRMPATNPPVIDRINAFNVALRDVQGKAHWVCHSSCARLIDDLQRLRFNDKGEIDRSNVSLSHPSDAEGYRIHYLRPVRVERRRTGGQFSVA